MTTPACPPAIRLRGVRQNNLKNFDLDVWLGRMTVITGLSGSGKSSLAFETLFAEGQRRYIETFSPYARQFFDRMDKPAVDRIEGIPPAIAVEQRNTVRTTRSTVGTMTELCDYLKLLWPHLARLHCQGCGQPVRRESPQVVWETLRARPEFRDAEAMLTFDLPTSEKLSLAESLELVARQGYQRLWLGGQILRVDEALAHPALRPPPPRLTIVQDRMALGDGVRARFTEAAEQAYHFGKGRLAVHLAAQGAAGHGAPVHLRFSQGFHCAACDRDYREPISALFSFNHPLGACPACKGFGRIITIDYDQAIPDRGKTLAQGCVKPWQTGHGLDSQRDLMKFCRAQEIPTNVPFSSLPRKTRDWVINGDDDYGLDEDHQWPRLWYGVKGYFRWLESKSYKMHVRVLLSRYRAYQTCPACQGQRFQTESLLYKVSLPGPGTARTKLSLADFYRLPVEEARRVIETVAQEYRIQAGAADPMSLALGEARARLEYLVEVGLGYLSLDRPMRTLSGGETERVNLTTCLGSRLCHTLFVLDEPSVGLHPRDTARLVTILEKLRDAGNTVVVVEHEASIMKAADRIVDLGPGQGEQGGYLVCHGTVQDLIGHDASLTGQYLSGRRRIELPKRRRVVLEPARGVYSTARAPSLTDAALALNEAALPFGRDAGAQFLTLTGAARHNLKDLTVAIPLGRLVCLTGVSGSGKTTLLRDVLLPALARWLPSAAGQARKASDHLSQEKSSEENNGPDESLEKTALLAAGVEGWESIAQIVLVDQSPLGKTPRSNPVVYLGAFDDIRDLFAETDLAKKRGLNGSAFSFNSRVGQCERCRGAGFEKIEMQFLSDVFIRCPECHGRRYRGHILEVKLSGENPAAPASAGVSAPASAPGRPALPPPRLHPRPPSSSRRPGTESATVAWSIADLLEATVDDALIFLQASLHRPAARRAHERLRLLQEVGLGYLRLGQPINTLSGGESQRLKLVSHLAEAGVAMARAEPLAGALPGRVLTERNPAAPAAGGSLLFLFDEPTTGLHFEDVRVLLLVFQRLVDAGHSLVVIEHNLDVIKCADWVIDLGPGAGANGGRIVAQGTPEAIAACPESHTGRFLRDILPAGFTGRRKRPAHSPASAPA